MDTTLIIADIHHKWERAETIILKECADNVIFLGDYFDDYGDNVETARKTATWLKSSLQKENRIHLLGNHDVPYMHPENIFLSCSGFTTYKAEAIRSVLNSDDWAKLKFFCFVDGWLLTHAGLHKDFVKDPETVIEFLQKENQRAVRAMRNQDKHWFYMAGYARGGYFQNVGGINWCDADDEFEPIPGVKQVVGHTPQKAPRWIDKNNLALDTGLRHYALLRDGKVTVKAYADL